MEKVNRLEDISLIENEFIGDASKITFVNSSINFEGKGNIIVIEDGCKFLNT